MKFLKSQDYWDWRSSSLTPLLKVGWITAGCSGSCPVGFWESLRMERRQTLSNLFQCFLCLNGISCISACAHYLLFCYWIPWRKVWFCLLHSLPCLHLMYNFTYVKSLLNIPLSRVTNPSALSLSFYNTGMPYRYFREEIGHGDFPEREWELST